MNASNIAWLQDLSIMQLLLTLLIAIFMSVYSIIYLLSHTPRPPFSEELQYTTIDINGERVIDKLTNVTDKRDRDDDILLSVVVPSYNETNRIESMLTEAIEYLQKEMTNKWEIIIVDDGSSDGTTDYCLKLSHATFKLKPHQLKVIHFTKNRGKGGAVRQGLMHANGQYALFADADGASKFSDVNKLLSAIKKTETADARDRHAPVVAVGSRAHMVNTDAVVKRSFIRNCLMYGLHTLVFVFGIRSIKDTQCGFKLFNRESITLIFPYMHTEGWIFDVEILLLSIRKNIPILEIPISWHEVGGSKMDLARDSIAMAKDLVVIRMAYLLGIYKDNKEC